MDIRVLGSLDAPRFQQLRLEGLRDCPTAFATHYTEECDTDIAMVAARLEPTVDRAVYGAFARGPLVGVVGVQRESRRNLRHKALIWGMYVTAASRGQGIGRQLLSYAVDYAAGMPGLRQVNLCVNAASASAIAMYRAAGFEPFGVERAFLVVDGAAQDLLHMVRVVDVRSA
jgi:RimJ/RimL family protein N-acetyltransferase